MKPIHIFTLGSLLVFQNCNSVKQDAIAVEFDKGRWIDLTYEFSDQTLYWPTAENFELDTAFEGITEDGYFYSAYNFCAAEHGGTHLDAPSHFAKGKWTADAIPLENLTGEAIVIDISSKAKANPDYQVQVSDLEEWEKKNGPVPSGCILLFRTGFGSYYPEAGKYLGTAEKGIDAVAKLHFPGIAPELATWIVNNRKIKAIGLDTPSVDFGQSKKFETHRILYAENICGFENVANLDQLPEKGAYVIALPMKIKGGSGAPLRIVAWMER
jgi:kynurenine formamidase